MKREDALEMAVGALMKMKADWRGGYRMKPPTWTAE
jgi:hypothetical protein